MLALLKLSSAAELWPPASNEERNIKSTGCLPDVSHARVDE